MPPVRYARVGEVPHVRLRGQRCPATCAWQRPGLSRSRSGAGLNILLEPVGGGAGARRRPVASGAETGAGGRPRARTDAPEGRLEPVEKLLTARIAIFIMTLATLII
jgi:hypothetical protein